MHDVPTRPAPRLTSLVTTGVVTVLATLLATAVVTASLAVTAPPAHAEAIEGYAPYQGADRCSPRAKVGTRTLGRWLVDTRGGRFGSISRSCSAGVSEHEEGRAFDWMLDAAEKKDRRIARKFLTLVRATDADGNTDALARRMGIMYIIWNDHIYKSYDRQFDRQDYLSSSCPSKRRCSKTLRHRDHVHISLSRAGGKGRTSWYDGRTD